MASGAADLCPEPNTSWGFGEGPTTRAGHLIISLGGGGQGRIGRCHRDRFLGRFAKFAHPRASAC